MSAEDEGPQRSGPVKPGGEQFLHLGTSMDPTLVAMDALQAVPLGNTPIEPGDVLIFRWEHRDINVIHRVVRISAEGIHTQGDNNDREDEHVVQPEEILGRIAARERGGRTRRVIGGRAGLLWRRYVRIRKRVVRASYLPLWAVYRLLAATRLLRPLSHVKEARVVRVDHPRGVVFNWVGDGKLIARLHESSTEWEILSPYRLFIDPRELPDVEELRRGGARAKQPVAGTRGPGTPEGA